MSDGELDLEGGKPPAADEESAPKPKRGGGSGGGRGRPSGAQVSTQLEGSIKGALTELAEWVDGRDPELAGTIKESADRIAKFLAVHAAKRDGMKRLIEYGFARGGPFAALRAFGPLARAIGDRVGGWREQRAEPEPDDDEFPGHGDGGPAQA